MELIANYNHSLSKAVGDSEIILLSLSELQFVETPGKSGSVRVSVLVSRTLLGTEIWSSEVSKVLVGLLILHKNLRLILNINLKIKVYVS